MHSTDSARTAFASLMFQLLRALVLPNVAQAICHDFCLALPGDVKCYDDVSDGGCCQADGRYSTTAECEPCSAYPIGSAGRWVCDDCFKPTSPCKGWTRAEKSEATCQETACEGGCLRDGVCDFAMNESICLFDGGGAWTFCQSCSLDLWKTCYWGSMCMAMCEHGCCSTDSAECPDEPYKLRYSGDCSICQQLGDHCQQCFTQSRCSTMYDSERPMAFPGMQSLTPTPTSAPTSVLTPLPTSAVPTAAPTAMATAASTAMATVLPTNSSTEEPPVGDELSGTTRRAAVSPMFLFVCTFICARLGTS